MNFSSDDWQKICDDYKRISEALIVIRDYPNKNDKLFNTVLDLLIREADRLFLDLNQIYSDCQK